MRHDETAYLLDMLLAAKDAYLLRSLFLVNCELL